MNRKIDLVVINFACGHRRGTDQYVDMLTQGFSTMDLFRVHKIEIYEDNSITLPTIDISNENILFRIPVSRQDIKYYLNRKYWRDRFFNIIIAILSPYFKEINLNPIWHLHDIIFDNFGEMLKNKFGGKTVSHIHCIYWKNRYELDLKEFNKLYKFNIEGKFNELRKLENIRNISYFDSDFIICVSEYAKNYIINVHKVNSSKIKVIYNGLSETSNIQHNRSESIVLLFVGKVSKPKGIFILLDALVIIQNMGYNFKLIIAGSCTGENRKYIEEIYNGIDIEYRGELNNSELSKLYSTATIGIIPSIYEQCSYVAIEMARAGLPIIVSEVDALAEMFENNYDALMIPFYFDKELKHDNNFLVDNIVKLINNQQLQCRLSKNIRIKYEKMFTLEKMIENTIDAYKCVFPFKPDCFYDD